MQGGSAPHPIPWIEEGLDSKSLHLSSTEIQSRMLTARPDELALEYTRTMMGVLLFNPRPAQIAMVGLGGGSLVKFCHRHLPHSQLLAIEINPHVIALRNAFHIPPDGERLQVWSGDAAEFMATTERRFDVLMLDAFGANGMPPSLGSERFYADGFDVLRPGGLLVVNLHAGHLHCPIYIERIARCFDGHLIEVPDSDGTNCIVFARKGEPLRCPPASERRPATLDTEAWAQLEPTFSRVAQAVADA